MTDSSRTASERSAIAGWNAARYFEEVNGLAWHHWAPISRVNERMESSLRVLSYLGVFLLINSFTCQASGADEPKQKNSDLVDYLIAGWKSERLKLNSGHVRITGARIGYKRVKDASIPVFEYKLSADSYFDASKAFYDVEYDDQKGRWLKLDDKVVLWLNSKASHVNIVGPKQPRSEYALNVDPRLLGIQTSPDILKGGMKSLDDAERQLKEKQLIDCKLVSNATYEVTWGFKLNGKIPALYTFHIDEEHGFSVVSRKVSIKETNQVISEALLKWMQKEGAWVPLSADMIEWTANYKIHLDLNWQSVNAPIPEERFDLANIGAPIGTLIVDHRLDYDKPLKVGRIGEKQKVKTNALPLTAPRASRKAIFLVVVLSLAIGVFVLKHLRARSAGQRKGP